MAIEYTTDSIFDTGADILVCPVNCKGVMGKGLALEFKRRFHEAEDQCKWFLSAGMLGPGRVGLSSQVPHGAGFVAILFAATKDHWRNPSKLEWVDSILDSIARFFPRALSQSIALPALGCGLGGLQWDNVRPLIERHLSLVSESGKRVIVCLPQSETTGNFLARTA